MDKRTRVRNAMDNLPVDHVPVSFWHHFTEVSDMGEAYAQAHLRYFQETDIDFIKIQSTGYFEYPLPPIERAADWWKLRPAGPEHPYIRDQVQRARRIRELVGDACCLFYTTFAPFSSIRFGAGEERVMQTLREDEAALMYALDVIAEDNALLARLLLTEAKMDGLYYCVQGGECSRMSEETYRRVVSPSDRLVLERANRYSDYNILHCCGWAGETNRLSLWTDYPAKAVNWAVHVEKLSLPEGRALFGNRCCLGGFEALHQEDGSFQGLLFHETKEEIQKAVRELILDYGKRGLILGADCVVDPKIDAERISWVVQAAREL